jgi:hypothetical protein
MSLIIGAKLIMVIYGQVHWIGWHSSFATAGERVMAVWDVQ